MSKAEQDKDQLVKWLLHEGVQYAGGQRRIFTHGPHTFYSGGELRLAKVVDSIVGEYQYDTHVPYSNLRDGDRHYEFRPDISTRSPIKIVGCSYDITQLEYFGGEFLQHDDIRKMIALRNETGKRGLFILPGHLICLEHEDPKWCDSDYDHFHSPGRAENLDEVGLLIMIDVLRTAGIEFYTDPEFHKCIATKSGRKFTARGHIFLTKPQKIIGIDEPIQYIRCVKKLTKSEIVSIESLHATRGINGYALMRQLILMYRREGMFKRRAQKPDKYNQYYGKNSDEPIKQKMQPNKRPNGGAYH